MASKQASSKPREVNLVELIPLQGGGALWLVESGKTIRAFQARSEMKLFSHRA